MLYRSWGKGGGSKRIGWCGGIRVGSASILIVTRLLNRCGGHLCYRSGWLRRHGPAIVHLSWWGSSPLVAGLDGGSCQCPFVSTGSRGRSGGKRVASGIKIIHEINQHIGCLGRHFRFLGRFLPRMALRFRLRLEGGFDGLAEVGFLLIGIVRRLNLSNIRRPRRPPLTIHRPPSRTLGHTRLPTPTPRRHTDRPRIRTHRLTPRQSQPINLGKTKKAPPIHEEIILPKSRFSAHGSRGMRHHLEHVVPAHRPREVNNGRTGIAVVNLLSVTQYQSFAAGDGPDQCDVVLLATACGSRLPRRECVGVGESETPSDAAFGVRDAFAAGDGGEVYGVEGTAAAGVAGGTVGGAAGRGGWHDGCLGRWVVCRFRL
mmetsp:Transcript_3526/g.6444  ORF Transcript_3526/g.6444 Transcript_3526/m.6444 type:complete len:372 (-) Transcript_3526:85-1200(-)